MNKIAALLEIQKLARDAQTENELGFVAVNKTNKITAYQQGVFWTYVDNVATILSVSGNVVLDNDGPYAQWVKDKINNYAKNKTNGIEYIAYDNQQMLGGKCNYIIPFTTKAEGLVGGLFIECDKEIGEDNKELLAEISEHYAQSLALIQLRHGNRSILSLGRLTRYKKYALIFGILLMLCPVRLSITAPAEIVAKSPIVIAAPYDGILDDISVNPGDAVTKETILATMDKTQIQSQKDTAEQAMRTAQVSLSRTGIESIRNSDKKTDLMRLRSEIKIKRIELNYASKLLKKADIIAPSDGIAIFSDISSLQNKPIKMGERIMMIANPSESELLIRVPAHALLPVHTGDETKFFLNVRPFNGMAATITAIGYQASVDDDGLLTYKIRAAMHDSNDVRIGWQGTAKIQTDWSILGYSLLRRPLIALRNMLGI